MTTKPKKSAKTKETQDKELAEIALRPSVNAAAVVDVYGKIFGEQSIGDLIEQLTTDIGRVKAGDMGRCEAMLMAQAEALQSIFVSLARKAQGQDYLKQFEANLKLALKAQNQCRMTLETLSNIKNPPVVYAKQANISNGPQQINNGTPPAVSHAEKTQNQPNELLEVQHGERLDTGATSETIGSNQAMATLE